MRNIVLLLLWPVLLFFCSCSKKQENPNDKARYDHLNLGTYKGILVGSSGYITIELKETGAKATLVFDDISYTLNSEAPIPAGTKITGYTLQKDDIKIVMDVNEDGSVPQVSVVIPGHNVTAVIFKATSTVQVENYTGSFHNTDNESPQYNNSGVLNFTIKGSDVALLSKCTTGNCDDESVTSLIGKIVRSGTNFSLNFNDCDPEEAICSLQFTKTTAGYKATEVIAEGIQTVIEIKKVE